MDELLANLAARGFTEQRQQRSTAATRPRLRPAPHLFPPPESEELPVIESRVPIYVLGGPAQVGIIAEQAPPPSDVPARNITPSSSGKGPVPARKSTRRKKRVTPT
jgi:hypothetical protein